MITLWAGRTQSNDAVLAAAADRSLTVTVRNGSAGTVELILDVNGYTGHAPRPVRQITRQE